MASQTSHIITKLIKILTAWLAVIALAWLLLESLFFCCTVNLFPYSSRVGLGFGIYPILQTSKSSTTPERYTAIFGDSYAFGSGDWFMKNQHQRNPTFSTAQILHQETGESFISFGIPGSSNLSGWVEDPESTLIYLSRNFRFHLQDPDRIFLYFYEGNDILDGYTDLQARYIANNYQLDKALTSSYFDNFITQEMLSKNPVLLASQKSSIYEQLYFTKMAITSINKFIDINGSEASTQQLIKEYYSKTPPTGNSIAIIDGKTTKIPDGISAPPVEMEPSHIAESLQFIDGIAGHVRRRFSNADITIIYIPSYAMTYDIASSHINIPDYRNPPNTSHSMEEIKTASNKLCKNIENIAKNNQLNFIDTRKDIRAAGQNKRLHGLFDNGHFDQAGYLALADSIKKRAILKTIKENECTTM